MKMHVAVLRKAIHLPTPRVSPLITACFILVLGGAACRHRPLVYHLGHPADLAREGFSSPVLQGTVAGRPVRLFVDTRVGVPALARWFSKAASLVSTPVASPPRDSIRLEATLRPAETALTIRRRLR